MRDAQQGSVSTCLLGLHTLSYLNRGLLQASTAGIYFRNPLTAGILKYVIIVFARPDGMLFRNEFL